MNRVAHVVRRLYIRYSVDVLIRPPLSTVVFDAVLQTATYSSDLADLLLDSVIRRIPSPKYASSLLQT
jgi:hypothetical protein